MVRRKRSRSARPQTTTFKLAGLVGRSLTHIGSKSRLRRSGSYRSQIHALPPRTRPACAAPKGGGSNGPRRSPHALSSRAFLRQKGFCRSGVRMASRSANPLPLSFGNLATAKDGGLSCPAISFPAIDRRSFVKTGSKFPMPTTPVRDPVGSNDAPSHMGVPY
jgi:hypothetical protein